MNCDPNNLSKLSSCLRCLTDAQLMQIRTWLMCQWSLVAGNALGANVRITQDNQIRITEDGQTRIIE